jgi:hypothetical protein
MSSPSTQKAHSIAPPTATAAENELYFDRSEAVLAGLELAGGDANPARFDPAEPAVVVDPNLDVPLPLWRDMTRACEPGKSDF